MNPPPPGVYLEHGLDDEFLDEKEALAAFAGVRSKPGAGRGGRTSSLVACGEPDGGADDGGAGRERGNGSNRARGSDGYGGSGGDSGERQGGRRKAEGSSAHVDRGTGSRRDSGRDSSASGSSVRDTPSQADVLERAHVRIAAMVAVGMVPSPPTVDAYLAVVEEAKTKRKTRRLKTAIADALAHVDQMISQHHVPMDGRLCNRCIAVYGRLGMEDRVSAMLQLGRANQLPVDSWTLKAVTQP
jgi:hypothetical protein